MLFQWRAKTQDYKYWFTLHCQMITICQMRQVISKASHFINCMFWSPGFSRCKLTYNQQYPHVYPRRPASCNGHGRRRGSKPRRFNARSRIIIPWLHKSFPYIATRSNRDIIGTRTVQCVLLICYRYLERFLKKKATSVVSGWTRHLPRCSNVG